MQRGTIGLREVRALQPAEFWDSAVSGFGARRQAGNAVSYFLKYRSTDGRQRWMTIGRHGSPWTPDMARDRARQILGEVVAGGDPSGEKIAKRKALTVAELCNRYFEDALAGRVRTRSKATKKASTLMIDRGRIDRHIKPLLGTMSAVALTRHDVEKFLHDVANGRTAVKTKTKTRGLARVTGADCSKSIGRTTWGHLHIRGAEGYSARQSCKRGDTVRG